MRHHSLGECCGCMQDTMRWPEECRLSTRGRANGATASNQNGSSGEGSAVVQGQQQHCCARLAKHNGGGPHNRKRSTLSTVWIVV
jgi:hypothetical protein